MDDFPNRATDRFKKRAGPQVSHGLNLALKLEAPSRLPLMLRDVVVSRPKIQRALDELDFLQFARFVPSSDGKALFPRADIAARDDRCPHPHPPSIPRRPLDA